MNNKRGGAGRGQGRKPSLTVEEKFLAARICENILLENNKHVSEELIYGKEDLIEIRAIWEKQKRLRQQYFSLSEEHRKANQNIFDLRVKGTVKDLEKKLRAFRNVVGAGNTKKLQDKSDCQNDPIIRGYAIKSGRGRPSSETSVERLSRDEILRIGAERLSVHLERKISSRAVDKAWKEIRAWEARENN